MVEVGQFADEIVEEIVGEVDEKTVVEVAILSLDKQVYLGRCSTCP